MKILIITGGSLEPSFLKQIYEENRYDYVIAADHGMDCARKIQLTVNLAVGDFDSASYDTLTYLKEQKVNTIQYACEKDYSDTHLALQEAIKRKPDHISIVGATGSRIDHMLGNIGLLHMALLSHIPTEIIDPCNRIRMIDNTQNLEIMKDEQYGTYVSLIPYTEMVSGIRLSGFVYPKDQSIFNLNIGVSMGISNEINKEKALIHIDQGALLVIESKDQN